MKKINRLLKNKDFKNVLDNKNSVANKEYVVYKINNNLNYIRIGISVSSKLGNSVVRHKIKRQVNEILKDLINININEDIVIIVRKKFIDNKFIDNKESLKSLLKKLSKGEK